MCQLYAEGHFSLQEGENVVCFEARAWPGSSDNELVRVVWSAAKRDIEPRTHDFVCTAHVPKWDFVCYTDKCQIFRIHVSSDGCVDFQHLNPNAIAYHIFPKGTMLHGGGEGTYLTRIPEPAVAGGGPQAPAVVTAHRAGIKRPFDTIEPASPTPYPRFPTPYGSDGVELYDGDLVYIVPLQIIGEIDYFHGHKNGRPVAQMMDDSDNFAHDMFVIERNGRPMHLIVRAIIFWQRRWRERVNQRILELCELSRIRSMGGPRATVISRP